MELAVVAVDEEEALGGEAGGGASIAGVILRRLGGVARAGFDADSLVV